MGVGVGLLINDGFVLASRRSDVTPWKRERVAASRSVPERERVERSPGESGGAPLQDPTPTPPTPGGGGRVLTEINVRPGTLGNPQREPVAAPVFGKRKRESG